MMGTSSEWVNWILLIGGFAIVGLLIYAAWWALFADRSKGRRRCPKCWYDMAYSPGMTCAECGYCGKKESEFARTRRRYGMAIAAIVGCTALTLIVDQRIYQRGVPSMLPTRLLLWLLPLAADSQSDIVGEIIARAGANQLSNSQWRAFIERCVSGDWRARPPDDPWVTKYGEFISQWRRRLHGDPALDALLLKIPPRIELSTRETWPLAMPVTVGVQLYDWWPSGTECRIRAAPHIRRTGGLGTIDLPAVTFYRTGDDRDQRPSYALDLPPLDETSKEIAIDFQIDRRPMRPGRTSGAAADVSEGETSEDPWQSAGAQTITVAARGQGTLQQVAESASDEASNEIIRQVFAQGVVKWASGRSPVRFRIELRASQVEALNDTAIGASVELLCDDHVARRLNLWWLAGVGTGIPPDRHYGFEVNAENAELLKDVNGDDGRWQLRVRSDPQIALRAGNAVKYWNGQLTIPLKVNTEPGEAPPRVWWKTGE